MRQWLLVVGMLGVSAANAQVAMRARGSVTPAVSASRVATLFLAKDGSVWGCGDGSWYIPPSSELNGFPQAEREPGTTSWISAGRRHAFADGLGRGSNAAGELGIDPAVLDFKDDFSYTPPVSGHPVAGHNVSYYLTPTGAVMAAGENSLGQLGNLKMSPFEFAFAAVRQASGKVIYGVKSVAAGSASAIALDSEGRVWTWGDNTWGQLGDGTLTPRARAARVSGLEEVVAVSASTGRYQPPFDNSFNFSDGSPVHDHVLALTTEGTVWGWGENRDGELGNGTPGKSVVGPGGVPDPINISDQQTRPVQVLVGPGRPLTHVKAIAAGGAHSLALRSDGTVWSWGYNGSGQLGDGQFYEGVRVGPAGPTNSYARRVPHLQGIQSIAAGPAQSYAIDLAGQVWSWGYNYYSNLCLGPGILDGDGRNPANYIATPSRAVLSDGTPFNLNR
jgi:alpha-tubulin suppressor-like RCC1 family protein